MPLINQTSAREKVANYVAYDHEQMAESSFSDVFAASLGYVVDEELSISYMLNREGFTDRRERVNALIRSGEVGNVDRYRTKGGRSRAIDYDAIAKDLGRDDIKTDSQLNEERAALLKSKRDYYEQTVSRGTGAAQFLGAMNAYMLDPVNLLTVGIAAPAMTARATSTVGRSLIAARNAALIEGGAELGIQALVYQHKQDINSPYSASDALANIAMAATGAGILGGVTEGISGWLKSVLKKSDELPETAELATAKSYLERQKETLKGSPKVDADSIKNDFNARMARQLSGELETATEESAAKIKADLDSLQKGETPESMRADLSNEIHKAQVDSDVEYLKEMDARGSEYATQTKDATTYQKPITEDVEPKAPPATASQREREILRAQGLDETFDAEMAKFDQLESKMLIVDDEAVDASAIVKQYDDEIKGLDSVLQCAYGGGAGKPDGSKFMNAFVGALNAKQ